mmetsp:Transcript_62038/g.145546  ORF Transcript_62038/g.145546 Transcript_62038/m.145546 type:complete len:202 (+) Transcript_62038:155-760(+)
MPFHAGKRRALQSSSNVWNRLPHPHWSATRSAASLGSDESSAAPSADPCQNTDLKDLAKARGPRPVAALPHGFEARLRQHPAIPPHNRSNLPAAGQSQSVQVQRRGPPLPARPGKARGGGSPLERIQASQAWQGRSAKARRAALCSIATSPKDRARNGSLPAFPKACPTSRLFLSTALEGSAGHCWRLPCRSRRSRRASSS